MGVPGPGHIGKEMNIVQARSISLPDHSKHAEATTGMVLLKELVPLSDSQPD